VKQETERQPTFDLLPPHLEGAVLGLDRLLQADDGGALLLEGLLLVHTRDAENHQFALKLRELNIPLLQRLLRRLASGTLPLERRPGVGKSGPLLLELPLSPLVGGTLLQELVLRVVSAATLASRVAFSSSASLAFYSAARALSSAWLC
jgi:hypothetical protein